MYIFAKFKQAAFQVLPRKNFQFVRTVQYRIRILQ